MAEATAMRNNVLAYPVYGLPYVVTFPILDADGDLVTGAAGLDSEVSKNGDTFADCTNEATEIATTSGIYYLSLTATEMTADVVTVIVKTSTTGAKTTTLTLYPVKLPSLLTGTAAAGAAGTITLADVAASLAVDDYFNGCLIYTTGGTGSGQARRISDYVGSTRVASVNPQWATTPDNTTTYEIYLTDTAVNALKANISAISDDAAAADNCELMFDGTGYAGGTTRLAVNASQIGGTNQTGRDIGASVLLSPGTGTGQVNLSSGNVTVGTNNDKTAYQLAADQAVNVTKFNGTTVTARDIGASVLLSPGTGTGQISLSSGQVTVGTLASAAIASIWNALTSGLTTAGSIGKLLVDNINATISSRSTYAGGDTSGTTTLLSRIASALTINSGKVTVGTNYDKTGYSLATDQSDVTIGTVNTLAAGAIASIWNALTSGMTTAGSIGKRIIDYLTGDIFARLGAPSGVSVSADIAAVNAKTTNLPASPAAVGSAMTLTADYDAAKTAASQTSVNTLTGFVDYEVGAIKAVTDKLDTALELDGAVYRFTANALEMAPTSAGSGLITWPFLVTKPDGVTPRDNVHVEVSTDAAGTNIIRAGYTNTLGIVTFRYDVAARYYYWCEKDGVSFNNPVIQDVA